MSSTFANQFCRGALSIHVKLEGMFEGVILEPISPWREKQCKRKLWYRRNLWSYILRYKFFLFFMTIIYGESKLDFKHAKQNFYAFLKGLKLHDHKLRS